MVTAGRWSLRNIYLYLVCLITLVMVIVAAVGLVRSSVELAYPDPGMYSIPIEKVPGQTQADLARQAKVARESSRRQAVLSIVGSLAMLLVAGPVYVYHWRKIETELPPKDADAAAA